MKDFSVLKAKIERLARECPRFVDDVLPHAVATVAANHFKENFQDESFEGDKWPEVNRRKDYYVRKTDGKTVKNYTKGAPRLRPILTGETGDLGRSIEPDPAKTTGGTAVVRAKHYGQFHRGLERSRLPWARGLKHPGNPHQRPRRRSRPPWARGLKPKRLNPDKNALPVAPPVGAWIEPIILTDALGVIEKKGTSM